MAFTIQSYRTLKTSSEPLTYAQKKKIRALLSQKLAPTQTAVAYQYRIKKNTVLE